MSLAIGTYTRVHVDSATGPHGQPLPMRERFYGACSGHCACAMDWAVLAELVAERDFRDNPPGRSLDAYHHLIVDSAAGVMGIGEIGHTDIVRASRRFIDPAWTPQDIDGYGWSFYADAGGTCGKDLHAFRPTSRPLALNLDYDYANSRRDKLVAATAHSNRGVPRTPRSLDDMRRMYYDIKMMYRMETDCDITYEDRPTSMFEHWYGGMESFSDTGAITLGSEVRAVARRVRETTGYRVLSDGAAWAMVEMWCDKDSPQFYNPETNHRRTVVVPCTLGGTLDTSRFDAHALKSWMQSVYGSFEDGHDYYAYARVAAVYADIYFPVDYYLVGWNWTPQGD